MSEGLTLSQATWNAGTATDEALISPAKLANINNRGSAKAWANYDGSVPSVRDSLNLSSLVDNTTGDFTANYSAAFANANYAAKGAPGRQSPTSTTAYWNFPTGSTLAYSVSATNFISGYSIGTSSGMGVLDCFITLFSCDGDLA
jgi:hypothetical protein